MGKNPNSAEKKFLALHIMQSYERDRHMFKKNVRVKLGVKFLFLLVFLFVTFILGAKYGHLVVKL
jgi:hypothetical protein